MAGKKRFFGCKVEGCEREHLAGGYCSMHYQRLRLKGDVGSAEGRMVNQGKKCAADGCDEEADTKGYCPYHYLNLRRHGDANHKSERQHKECTVVVDGIKCNRRHAAKGMCMMHYQRFRETGSVGPLESTARRNVGKCLVEDCEADAKIRGYCSKHYTTLKRYGDAEHSTRPRSPEPRENAYVFIRINGEPVAEHRYVMEQKLGRQLLPTESVHHKNGQRWDNRPENLELWVVAQPFGQRPSDLIQYATEILVKYGTRSNALDILEAIDDRDAGPSVCEQQQQQDLDNKIH